MCIIVPEKGDIDAFKDFTGEGADAPAAAAPPPPADKPAPTETKQEAPPAAPAQPSKSYPPYIESMSRFIQIFFKFLGDYTVLLLRLYPCNSGYASAVADDDARRHPGLGEEGGRLLSRGRRSSADEDRQSRHRR